jgi:hypothetical protein
VVLADVQRGPHALVGVRRRQPDVDDDHVRRVGPDPHEQLVGRAALRGDLHSGAGQQTDQAVPQQQAVLGDRYPHAGPPPPNPTGPYRVGGHQKTGL